MRISIILFFVIGILFQAEAQTNPTSKDTTVQEQVYTYIQEYPKFPGGDVAFQEFLAKNLVYPADAQKKKIQGTVFVSFYIEIDGSVTDVKVVPNKGLSPSCDQAAVDLISKSPKWSPGRRDGNPVKTKMIVKVRFALK